ncbi:MAG: trypsin-like peptidase domain-containing protein [Clostridiales bacterium]|nr:trypsin-like peptidase domain-containing protein [Clostridiales bacterium]
MKKVSKVFTLVLALAMILSLVSITASAKNISPSEMQKSVVYIYTAVKFEAKNATIGSKPLSVEQSGWGTGFAIGKPGQPVQYIATCDHVVGEKDGIYTVYIDQNGNIVGLVEMDDGTSYPKSYEQDGYICIIDYFEAKTTSLDAVFSGASSDYVSLSVVGSSYENDVAVCKIASEPTNKIIARPLKLKEKVSVGDSIYAIGYPYHTEFANTEGRYDYSDSTVTKGVISKIQLTEGHRAAKQQFYTYVIDANIANGNSGGPLFTEDGSIIGVNAFVAKDKSRGDDASANYSIAIESLIKVLDSVGAPYVLDNDLSIGLIIAIIAAAIVLIAAVVILLAVRNKQNLKPATDTGSMQVSDMGGSVNNGSMTNGFTGVTEGLGNVSYPGVPQPQPQPSGKKYLLGISGPMQGKKFSIDEIAVIGRDPSRCNVVFPTNQAGVSGRHCEVAVTGNTLSLKDLNSSYGTFLKDGTRIAPNVPVVLKSGDQFIVGDKEIVFEVRY